MINFHRSAPATKAVSLSPYRQPYTLKDSFTADHHYGVDHRTHSRQVKTATKKINKLVGVYEIDNINIHIGKLL